MFILLYSIKGVIMYRLKQLISLTPKKVRDRAKFIKVLVTRTIKDLDAEGKIFRKIQFKASDKKGSGTPHLITVRLYGKNEVLNSDCWIHCSCEYFTFNLEVALTTQGSSSVINSNGALPVEKNPEMKGHLCKHLIATIPYIRNAKFSNYKTKIIPTQEEIDEELTKLL